jgi:NADH:ubiquinone oxidoreductase subunit K
MGLISLVWGIVAMLLMFIGLVPLLGWSNWLVIPFAGVGAIIAAVGIALTSREKNGRAKAGLVLNAIVIVVAVIRLSMGGGIL